MEISELENKFVVIVITVMSIRQLYDDVNSTTIPWSKQKIQGISLGTVNALSQGIGKNPINRLILNKANQA